MENEKKETGIGHVSVLYVWEYCDMCCGRCGESHIRRSVADIEISTKASNIGIVNGDGVRLRAQPSLSSTVLETMYKREVVVIDYSQSNGTWYKVTRQKTGRSGWVTKTYITTM